MTLQIFLYLYYAFLAVWAVISIAAVYHVFRFSLASMVSVFVSALFIAVSCLILLASFRYIAGVNWQEPINIIVDKNIFSN